MCQKKITSETDTIYLFNSGYREQYLRNILSSIYLPTGSIVEYKYEPRHIHEELLENKRYLKGARQVLLVYVDRHGEKGCVFHPLRFGVLLYVEERGAQHFYIVSLGDYVYPKSIEDFQIALHGSINSELLPATNSSDPNKPAENKFAIRGKSCIIPENMYLGDGAWTHMTESISKTKQLSNPEKSCAFVRIRFFKDSLCRKEIKVLRKSRSHYIRLNPKQTFTLQVSYYFPPQEKDPSVTREIEINLGRGFTDEKLPLRLDGKRNSKDYMVHVRDFPEIRNGSISLTCATDLHTPEKPINFRLVTSYISTLQLVFSIIFYGLINALISKDFSVASSNMEAHSYGLCVINYVTRFIGNARVEAPFLYNAIIYCFQAGYLFFVLRVFGKKVL